MVKVSPVVIKYIIHAKFQAVGAVENPDVIGAIFGQTEGLLGDELELRDLQREGKIGRIDVKLETKEGKTEGEIEIPTSLDKAETSIIAAALETIEKIGPSEAKIKVEEIEDVRGSKREYIIERAKELLSTLKTSLPETRELQNNIKIASRAAQFHEYGRESLPAGNLENDEIIVVEGRADVLNLLRCGVDNVIAMNGTILPETIKELGKSKKLILFVDGDRGGQLIAKNAIKNANIAAVVQAPAGKEVEELNEKEVLSCLRKHIPPNRFLEEIKETRKKSKRKIKEEESERNEQDIDREIAKPTSEELEIFRAALYDLIGTRGAVLFDKQLNIIKRVPLSELGKTLNTTKAYSVVMDGMATALLLKAAERAGCKHVVARNFAFYNGKINLVSL